MTGAVGQPVASCPGVGAEGMLTYACLQGYILRLGSFVVE